MKSLCAFCFVTVLWVTGCGPESRAEVRRISVPEDAAVFSFGSLDGTSGSDVEVLSRITDVALSESGRFVAIQDGAAPFIRVLDRDNHTSWSFGPQGEGPGELRNAWGLEFLGDSILLILSGRRVERFTPSGDWMGSLDVLTQGVRAMSITSGCGGEIFVYGVPRQYEAMDSVVWLHQLAPSGSGLRSRLIVPGSARGSVRYGALFGLDGTNDGVFVWHSQLQSGIEVGYWVPCDGSEPRVVDHTDTSVSLEEALSRGGEMALQLILPDTLVAGAVAQNTVLGRAFSWQDGDARITTLRVYDDAVCAEVELDGGWRVFDMHNDIIAMARSAPFPMVLGVELSWIKENLTEIRCLQSRC